jgi:M6 family metalloprotease-like protein
MPRRPVALALALLAGLALCALAAAPHARPRLERKGARRSATAEDLTGYRTVDRARTTRITSSTGPEMRPGYLGVSLEVKAGALVVASVAHDSPADRAGIRTGDVLRSVDGKEVRTIEALGDLVRNAGADKELELKLKRGGKTLEETVKLAGTSRPLSASNRAGRRGARTRGWDDRRLTIFKGSVFRLAVVGIEYPDVKHNPAIKLADWEKSLFSRNAYKGKSPTGQRIYGSLNDYYLEQSCGALRVEGKVFKWVQVGRKRLEYNVLPARSTLLTEALDKLWARDGKDALKGFDGVFFLYAGARLTTGRGGLYWPHKGWFTYKDQRWSYFLCPEGGKVMSSISVIAHEFGHMLGMPDLYARPDSPGSEGLGLWCTMSTGHGKDGKPLHFSAWCKEQLGWLKPAVIDPRVKQKLILAPVHGTTRECYKVLVRPDASEYLLLENRVKKGFDRDLPGEGMLIWRVVRGRPVLEVSHGITTPEGPQRFLGAVPYPSPSNTTFTPYTTPSSRPRLGSGWPVHITNIRKLPDGRITFHIGYEYL